MADGGVTINRAEISRILREDMRGPVEDAAIRIAMEAEELTHLTWGDGSKPDVTTKNFITDRAVTVVRVNHPGALRDEAKNGTLTRAAASIGLEVKSK